MDTPQEFFQALYSQVSHGLAEIRLLHKSGDIKLAKKIYRPATDIHTGNFDYLREVNTDYHVYHRVNVSQDPRSRKADITQVVALWVEIDNSEPDIPERLTDYPLPPTMLLHSGSGYHAYFLLKEPLMVADEKERYEVERTLEGMILAWGKDSGGDIHTRDITRILRTPFFFNVKDKYAPDYPMCRVIWYDDSMGDRYKFSQLHKQYAPLGKDRNQPIIRRSIPVVRDGSRPKWVMDYLEQGAAQGERNQRLFAVARWFNDVGDKSSQAESELIARGLADGLDQHEAMNTIRSAWLQTPDTSKTLPRHIRNVMAFEDENE